jgi:ribonuclease III
MMCTSKKNKKANKDIVTADQALLIARLESRIGFVFKNKHLIRRALTHRSFIKEDKMLSAEDHNERLEFLGDAILGLVTAEQVFEKLPHAHEGMLTQLRSSYICQPHLASAASRLGLGSFMRAAKAMRLSGSVELPSVLSDVMEAIFAAAYLDQGFEAAKRLILHTLGPVPLQLRVQGKDPKTELQERFQAVLSAVPSYKVVGIAGPSHEPVFKVEIWYGDTILAEGQGSSKKEATQKAAETALLKVDVFLKGFTR